MAREEFHDKFEYFFLDKNIFNVADFKIKDKEKKM